MSLCRHCEKTEDNAGCMHPSPGVRDGCNRFGYPSESDLALARVGQRHAVEAARALSARTSEPVVAWPSSHQVGGSHYTQTKLQPWDVMKEWFHKDQNPFEMYAYGNALKYLFRYRRKGNPKQDIDKAIHYLEKLKEEL